MTWGTVVCAVVAVLLLATEPTSAQPAAADRFALCASCHGEHGVSPNFETPSLAGQHSPYALRQLFLFRAGRRPSDMMKAMVNGMSDADLRTLSEIIGTLPAAPPFAPAPADPARMARGGALADKTGCTSCHRGDFGGDNEVPRLAGQREDYLGKTLAEFRSGVRVDDPKSTHHVFAALTPADLGDLAHYLAHIESPLPASAPAR